MNSLKTDRIVDIEYNVYGSIQKIDNKTYYFDVSSLPYVNGYFVISWFFDKQLSVAVQDAHSKNFTCMLSAISKVYLDDNARIIIEFKTGPADTPDLVLTYRRNDYLNRLANRVAHNYSTSFKEALSYLRELQEHFPDMYEEKERKFYELDAKLQAISC